MRYVTFDPATGQLLGSYIQDLSEADSHHFIEVLDDEIYRNWNSYQANPSRDGLEPIAVISLPAPVPQEVAMVQISLALLDAGRWDATKSYFANLPADATSTRAKLRFDRSPSVRRDCDLVLAVIAALGITSAEADALFITAAAIQ